MKQDTEQLQPAAQVQIMIGCANYFYTIYIFHL